MFIIIILWSFLKKATGRVFTAEKFYPALAGGTGVVTLGGLSL